MEIQTSRQVVLTLTEEEFTMLRNGIGKTSVNSRIEAGMSEKESEFFVQFYSTIGHYFVGA